MQNIVLTVHLIIAVLLTGAVLLQRSEGGGLGMGGGSGVMTGRQAANAMTRITWVLGIALFVTSIALTVIAARESSTGSIMDRLGSGTAEETQSETNLPELSADTPPTEAGQPLTPPAPDAVAPAAPQTDAAAPADAAPAEAAPAETAPVTEAQPVTPPAAETPAPAN